MNTITPNRTGRSPVSIIIIIMIIMALFTIIPVIMIRCFFSNADEAMRESCTQSVQAEVIDNVKKEGSGRKGKGHYISYAAVYRYVYKDKTYEKQGSTYLSDPYYQVGDTAEIMIDPDKPENFYDPDVEEEFRKGSSGIFMYVPFIIVVFMVIVFSLIVRKVRVVQR